MVEVVDLELTGVDRGGDFNAIERGGNVHGIDPHERAVVGRDRAARAHGIKSEDSRRRAVTRGQDGGVQGDDEGGDHRAGEHVRFQWSSFLPRRSASG